jgi:phenylacetate-coenzyme A ligase PaaK-like adenylate-forming protein
VSARRSLAEGCYWVSKRLQGEGAIRRRLATLTESQWLDPEQVRALQLEKLERLVAHCYEAVPHYREAMDDRGIVPHDIVDFESFAALPVLTRETLSDQAEKLTSSSVDPHTLRLRHTSGSTGERVTVSQDPDFDMWCRAHQLRTYSWCGGWRLGDPFVLIWGSPVLFETRSRRQRLDNRLSRRVELNAFRLDRRSIDRMLDALARLQPRLISGYTTALHLLAQRAVERGIELTRLAAVQTTAEPLPPPMRSAIAAGFDCEVFDKYGSRETSIVAHEAPAHEGMCIQAEHTYVEFLTAEGTPCRPGQPGRLVLTTLNNFAQPLLRYETADIAAPLEGRCKSGIGLPLMTPVEGRLHDVICAPDGGMVHPQLFSNVMRQVPQVKWFQVVQQRDARLLLRLVTPTGSLSEPTRGLIAELVRRHSGFDYEISFEQLEDMPKASTTTGKYRVCVSTASAHGSEIERLNAMRAGDEPSGGDSRARAGGA